MTLPYHKVKIEHEKFGTLVNESFVNSIQFKLFLKMIQGCIELKNDLTFYNGTDFLVHIPFKYLVESIILTSTDSYSLVEHYVQKSKMEI
jgi:hypothetical protein